MLQDPSLNLWAGIRFDALNYFKRNNIAWWRGKGNLPTGHLLSSQIAGVNHLYFLRQRKDLASAILQAIDPKVKEAIVVDDGYVEFEFIGERQYLKESSFKRGANCTSVDAVMIGRLGSGAKRLFLIEWKYTETYSSKNQYIKKRSKVYDPLLKAPDSPFLKINAQHFYYEPFYQLMRQTLLGAECAKHSDHGVSSYRHIHVVPKGNKSLRQNITSPGLMGEDIHEAWHSVLKNKEFFLAVTPENFLLPVRELADTASIMHYLEFRYWK